MFLEKGSTTKQDSFLEMIQLIVRKMQFYFSADNPTEQFYFVFMEKSAQKRVKHSYIFQWL